MTDDLLEDQLDFSQASTDHKQAIAKLWAKECELIEGQVEILSNLVNISNEERESQWVRIAGGVSSLNMLPYREMADLDRMRGNSRDLADRNPFAINIIENGKSYIYGTGHNYRIKAKQDKEVSKELLNSVSRELELFRQEYPLEETPLSDAPSGPYSPKLDKWWLRQLETWGRFERDGEVFRRKFIIDNKLYLRFIEPEQVVPPVEGNTLNLAPFGIEYRKYDDGSYDTETPVNYFVRPLDAPLDNLQGQPRPVPASEIQHIKANVDMSAPRGVPTLYAIDANLRRAARILRNMSTVTEMQAAIAWVQKHLTATTANLTAYVSSGTDVKVTNNATGKEKNFRNYDPGSILHSNASMQYEPWAVSVDVAKIVGALSAELRTIAARVQYPEFMVSSDASNANYSSTMVAEGPAVKRFQRLQFFCIAYDLEILYLALSVAAAADRLPSNILELIEIECEPPTAATRDKLKEIEGDILLAGGPSGTGPKVMSKKTLASRQDLDWDKERVMIEEEEEASVKQEAKLAPLKPPPTPKPIDPNIPVKAAAKAARNGKPVLT